jgi:hypothetical protein
MLASPSLCEMVEPGKVTEWHGRLNRATKARILARECAERAKETT